MSGGDRNERSGLTRRDLLRMLGMAGAGAFVSSTASAWQASSAWANLIGRATAVAPAGSDLGAIDHFVFLMLENRSYDHYFGAYPKGRGFDDHAADSLGVFAQDFPSSVGGSEVVPTNKLLPWHLNGTGGFECTDDLTHDWNPMHACWNNGKMDSWVKVHTESQYEGERGVLTMGYYTRNELPFHWALADNFTLCDAYFSSILGPTHPNRLMQMSGTIDPNGTHGGPVIDTATGNRADVLWSCTWPTMPEVLQDSGISWKVYSPSDEDLPAQYQGLVRYPTWSPYWYLPATSAELIGLSDNVLPYFASFQNPSSALYELAFKQTFPGQFVADVASGTLPSVSWIIPPLGFDEHPAASPANGQFFTSMVLEALVANPEVWARTALFIMYDENDGWFDHVAPPVAPAGTPDEYLASSTVTLGGYSETLESTGPLGFGVRVPALMVSPFSRGGHIATETFDHTSQLKLIAERFGVTAPNLSVWRQQVAGNLTSTMFQQAAEDQLPSLPKALAMMPVGGYCVAANQDSDASQGAAPQAAGGRSEPMFLTKQRMPNQSGGSDPASKYFKLTAAEQAVPEDRRTVLPGVGTATAKSAYNKIFSELTQAASDS